MELSYSDGTHTRNYSLIYNLIHYEVVANGAEAINEWRERNPYMRLWLPLSPLRSTDLRGANLSGADLTHSDLRSCNLSESNLGGAILSQAILQGANLDKSDLSGADLTGAVFVNTNMEDTDFRNTLLGGTVFSGIDLSSIKNLDCAYISSPCEITLESLLFSAGKVSDELLQRLGVPDTVVEYLPSLRNAMNPIEYYSCFISYSTKDEEFCKRLYEKLRASGLRVWFAPHHMQAGKKLYEQIDTAIRIHDKLLLVLSKDSMSSQWVETEIYNAITKEKKENRQVLFPIRLVDFDELEQWKCFNSDVGKDMAREIREYFIPDFSNWKNHDDFESAFVKLLRAMKHNNLLQGTLALSRRRP